MFQKYDKILIKYNIDPYIIESKWNEPNRVYHNIDHLLSILKQIENKYDPNDYIYEFYILAAFSMILFMFLEEMTTKKNQLNLCLI
jgi:hypothetical protein